MAIVTILSSGSTQGHKPLKNVLDYCMQEAKTLKDGTRLVSGIDCLPESSYAEMMATKKQFGKLGGREYYHILQSFSPDEGITPEQAHEIALEFAEEQFKGYETVVATHVDRDHIHSHIVLNSVSHINGKKYHSDKDNIPRLRAASDEICRRHGLSVIEDKESGPRKMGTREYHAAEKGESWKINLMATINIAMQKARTKDEFIRFMEDRGYKVTWTDTRKNITYTTPEGRKCRDNKLHLSKFLKENMTYEFDIRRQISERIRQGSAQSYGCSEADSMRDDLGRELEEHRDDAAGAAGSDGLDQKEPEWTSDSRTDEGLPQSDRDYPSRSRGELDDRVEEGIIFDEGGAGLTGWEDERRICFSTEGYTQGFSGSNGGLFGPDVSQDAPSLPSYDIALSGARLIAYAGRMIDSCAPSQANDIPESPKTDKKEFEKIAEKNEAHGIKMG